MYDLSELDVVKTQKEMAVTSLLKPAASAARRRAEPHVVVRAMRVASSIYSLAPEAIRGKNRVQQHCFARAWCCYHLVMETGLSLPDIAHRLGMDCHSSVCHHAHMHASRHNLPPPPIHKPKTASARYLCPEPTMDQPWHRRRR